MTNTEFVVPYRPIQLIQSSLLNRPATTFNVFYITIRNNAHIYPMSIKFKRRHIRNSENSVNLLMHFYDSVPLYARSTISRKRAEPNVIDLNVDKNPIQSIELVSWLTMNQCIGLISTNIYCSIVEQVHSQTRPKSYITWKF